jgi:hypothetical protein
VSIADKIPEEFLWCRDMGHNWDPGSLTCREHFNRRVERWEIWRTVRCDGCGGTKIQKLTKAYQFLRSDYDYPDGYAINGGSGYRLTREERAAFRERSTKLRGGVTKQPKGRKKP